MHGTIIAVFRLFLSVSGGAVHFSCVLSGSNAVVQNPATAHPHSVWQFTCSVGQVQQGQLPKLTVFCVIVRWTTPSVGHITDLLEFCA